jgi:hypothetical protein
MLMRNEENFPLRRFRFKCEGRVKQFFFMKRRPHGRPMRRWEDNIKIYLREMGWRDMDWIDQS